MQDRDRAQAPAVRELAVSDRLPAAETPHAERFYRMAARLLLAGLVLCLMPLLSAATSADRMADADRGSLVLEQRGCLDCHALAGSGGGTAPDLQRRSLTSDYSPAGMAALMWNHGPSMWQHMEERSMEIPPLEPTEADDLFAFFWRARYFDLLGEAQRGKALFAERGCSTCHAVTREQRGDRVGPAVEAWESLTDAVGFAQMLWNHSTGMLEAHDSRGLSWPRFTEQEMVDLLLYLQNTPATRTRQRDLTLPSADGGEAAFSRAGCASCHTVGDEAEGRLDLGSRARGYRTLTGLATGMWNHAPDMIRQSRRTGTQRTPISRTEMAAVIAHLWNEGAFEERGRPERGRKVFHRSGCADCHQGADERAPRIASTGRFTAATMSAAVWSHGPAMVQAMTDRGRKWPQLSAREMADLIAFLNSGAD